MDLAVVNTNLLTFSGKGLGIIRDGAVGMDGDRISFVGESNNMDTGDVREVMDGSGCVTMPGLIDAHAHTGLSLLRGAAQDMPELQWMKKGLAPFAAHMDEEDMIAGCRLGVLEGLRAGTTTFCEYARNVEELVRKVYQPFNTRVVAVETLNEVVGVTSEKGVYELDPSLGDVCLKRANKLVKGFKGQTMVRPCYGPQAMDMLSLDLLEEINSLSKENDVDIHMHVAQGERERIQVTERYGRSSVEQADKMGLLHPGMVAIHCHDTSQDEKEMIVSRGARVVCCPSSISMIDGIVPPVHDFITLGAPVGLGSDQAPGPGTHNIFKEMRTASLLTKVRHTDPTLLPSWQVLKLGTIGGARALGIHDLVGSLEVGKYADIITVNLNKANLVPYVTTPFHNFVPNLVHSSSGGEVRDVIVNGRVIMKDRCLLDIDENRVIGAAQERASKLFERGAEAWWATNNHMVQDVRNGYY